MPQVLQSLAAHVTERHLVISIAAGITIDTIEAALGRHVRVVRVMPNTPALGAWDAGPCAAAVLCPALCCACRPPSHVCPSHPHTRPAAVQAGASAYALGTNASEADAEVVDLLFSSVGFCIQVEEKQLDAVTGKPSRGCHGPGRLSAAVYCRLQLLATAVVQPTPLPALPPRPVWLRPRFCLHND